MKNILTLITVLFITTISHAQGVVVAGGGGVVAAGNGGVFVASGGGYYGMTTGWPGYGRSYYMPGYYANNPYAGGLPTWVDVPTGPVEISEVAYIERPRSKKKCTCGCKKN